MQVCKPGSVSSGVLPPGIFYHLSMRPTHLGFPTSRDRTGRPKTETYLAFQHPRFTIYKHYCLYMWALTPHFHYHPGFYPVATWFLWHSLLQYLSGIAPAFSHGGSPYVARTFLCGFNPAAIEQPAFKFTDFSLIGKNNIREFITGF
jgi:hypothetical protein